MLSVAAARPHDEIFSTVAADDTPPQFWGDITLWAKINALADRTPPLVRIEGPGGAAASMEEPAGFETLQDQSASEQAGCRRLVLARARSATLAPAVGAGFRLARMP